MAYDIGDLVRCRAAFSDPDLASQPVDPSSVVFKFKTPAGVVTSYTYGVGGQVVREATGQYRVDVSVGAAGSWYYRFEATGTYQAAQEASFTVTQGAF